MVGWVGSICWGWWGERGIREGRGGEAKEAREVGIGKERGLSREKNGRDYRRCCVWDLGNAGAQIRYIGAARRGSRFAGMYMVGSFGSFAKMMGLAIS